MKGQWMMKCFKLIFVSEWDIIISFSEEREQNKSNIRRSIIILV